MTRRRIAFLKRLRADVRESARRRRDAAPPQATAPDLRTSDELERRLDETRERLRREIPPPDEH